MDNQLSGRDLSSAESAERPPLGGSSWWRATRYEIVAGTHIAPASDASIEIYDPLEDQKLFWGGRRKMGVVAPYVSLAELAQGDEGAICAWCEQFGLLGILHHRLDSASLWPTWAPFQLPAGIRSVKPVQIHLERGLALRRVVAEASHSPQTFRPEDYHGRRLALEELGPAINQSKVLREHLATPGARFIDADGAEREASIVEGVVQFFPRIRDVCSWTAWHAENAYPHLADVQSELRPAQAGALADRLAQTQIPDPRSREFLHAYGEPLHLFRQWVHTLRDILGFWERAGGTLETDELEPVPKSFEVLLRSVSPGVRFNPKAGGEGPWQPTWAVPSLLAALGVMILQEIPLGRANIRRCAECGKVMTAAHPKRRYCDETCRGTFNQRKWRERKKERDDE